MRVIRSNNSLCIGSINIHIVVTGIFVTLGGTGGGAGGVDAPKGSQESPAARGIIGCCPMLSEGSAV